MKIEAQIERLTKQLKSKKARLASQKLAERNRKRANDRRARDQRIYKLGGMVEKMGLDALDDDLLLGMLCLMNRNAHKPSWCRKFLELGKPYLAIGKKLPRPSVPSAERIKAATEVFYNTGPEELSHAPDQPEPIAGPDSWIPVINNGSDDGTERLGGEA